MKSQPSDLPSLEYLNECFNYNPSTGELLWKLRPPHHFKLDYVANSTGRLAGTKVGKNPRLDTKIISRKRLCYKLGTGTDPKHDIVFKDGNKSNFKLSNLLDTDVNENYKSGLTHDGNKKAPSFQGLYCIKFSNGTVKIGKSINVLERISNHKATAAAFSTSIIEYHYVEIEKDLDKLERFLISKSSNYCSSVIAREWLVNGDYYAIKNLLMNIEHEYSIEKAAKHERLKSKTNDDMLGRALTCDNRAEYYYSDGYKFKKLPPQWYLKECFDYNPETGELFWKERPITHFPLNSLAKGFNQQFSGKLVGGTTKGKIKLMLNGRTCLGHRIIWKLVTGEEPKTIKHLNGDNLDNRFTNLIAVPHSSYTPT